MNDDDIVKELIDIKGFPSLRNIQKQALEKGLLDPKTNMVVISATASGKTFVAELSIFKHLKNDGKVLYLVPQTALIEDKFRDLEYLEKQGYQISKSGETSSDADVLITTFESFYRGAIHNLESYKRFGHVVLDEFHLLYDQNRGFTLEKAICLIKEWNPKILCLSATFRKIEDASGWLDAEVVENYERPIPIKEDIMDLTGSNSGYTKNDLSKAIYEKIKTPCLIFCGTVPFTRSRAEDLADFLRNIKKGKPVIDVRTADEKINVLDEIKAQMSDKLHRDTLTPSEENLARCMAQGVAFHNSHLSSEIKAWIEDLFINEKLNYLFSTTTLAYGFNSPTKTVVLSDVTRYASTGQVPIPVYEYMQCMGRAGRSKKWGNEAYSFVAARSDEQKKYIIEKYHAHDLEEARSHITFDDFARKSILELIYSGSFIQPKDIIRFYENTLFKYQYSVAKQTLTKFELEGWLVEHISWLKKHGFISQVGINYKLTDFGKMVVDFLFKTYRNYQLDSFRKINEYLIDLKEKEGNEIKPKATYIYTLIKIMDELNLSKIPKQKSDEVEKFFIKNGITPGNKEYSYYAMVKGWMNNRELDEIENRLYVYASPIPNFARELADILELFKEMAREKEFTVSSDFEDFKISVEKGVPLFATDIVKISGIGRNKARNLTGHLSTPLVGRKQPIISEYRQDRVLKVLKEVLKSEGEKEVRNIISHVDGFGEKLTTKIIERISGNGEEKEILDL
ncbi:hypothetical protein A2Z22_01950 [Candidatus Woesebacteria bacterium RBG_16_34_12]|uniref:DEAD/DEAH box helicase n=1 Tax=Candidatus Woesebacteria bacterium RBG_16_34_12 TaxID=1802480 RepID=A0A1F7XCD0_9BACT|nr:MAG: hypothetical protein A2Z22_01950 [Candidatus Woesebacteria bacterium RBG_16_34_12]